MTHRAILFLDFDGVLVTADYQKANGGNKLDPAKVELVRTLLFDMDARVVVTSNWRGSLTQMRNVLAQAGLRNARHWVIGVTPRLARRETCRGDEIQAWLTQAGVATDDCVILDDDDDMGGLRRRLVRCDYRVGLTQEDVVRAEARLLGYER